MHIYGMKVIFISSILVCALIAFVTGCVDTVDGHVKAGMPIAKDTIAKRFDRPAPLCAAAARKVLTDSGKLTVDHIAANTLEAQINERTVWVRVEAVDSQISQVSVQARSKWGTDIELAADISTKIALQLTTMK